MQSTKATGAGIAAVVLGLALATLAYADAGGSIPGGAGAPAAPEPVPAEPSVQVSEAEAAIMRADLNGRMEAALGDAYGGVWFERSTAQLHVGVTSPGARRLAEAVAARAGLSTIVAETHVDSSLGQLLAAQKRWSHRLADLFEEAEAKTSLVLDRNSLQVELDPAVPSAKRVALEEAAAAAGVDIAIVVASHPNLSTRVADRCGKLEKFKAYCNPTIVGGVSIDDEWDKGGYGDCTAGPAVINKKRAKASTETFILTAGHCIFLSGGVGKKWFAFDKNGKRTEIGKAVNYIFDETDIGVIKVEPTTWATANDPIPVVPTVAMWDMAKETTPTEVKADAEPVKDMKVCYSGQRSGTQCGIVKNTSVESSVEYVEKGVVKTVVIKNLVEVEVKTGKAGAGDSGAPLFSEATKSTVLGVMATVDMDPKTEEGTLAYFHSMKTAFAKLKDVKKLEYELLKEDNKQRHAKFKAVKYPATIYGASAGTEKFTTEAGSVECKEGKHHAVLMEASSTLTVTPEYKGCVASFFGLAATVSMEGCTFVFHVAEKTSTDNYGALMDVACPTGQSIKLIAGTCKAEVKAQNGLEIVDLVNDSAESPKRDLTARPTVAGIAYTVTQDGILCPFNGMGEKTNGAYTNGASTTLTGQVPGSAERIDIEVADG
jgi:hypothetical protein